MVAKHLEPITQDFGPQNVFLPLSKRLWPTEMRRRRMAPLLQPAEFQSAELSMLLPVFRCFETDKQGYHFEICPFRTITQIDRGHRTLAGNGQKSRWLVQARQP